MWLLPIDCAGLSRAIPPGQYLLPWYASHYEIDALCGLLRTVLEGIRCELRLDDVGLTSAVQRGVKARDALVVACLEDTSASFEQASGALRSLGARYSLLQFPLPQEAGYGWLEQEIKMPLFEAIGRMVAESDHPLAPFNIRALPVLEAAALTTDPIEFMELLERTVTHRLKYAEIGTEASDYLRSLLLVSGKRLAERLLRLIGGERQTALEVIAHQGKGPTDNLRFRAGAAALERVGLARYVSGDLSLGPLARRALDAPLLGAVESTLPDDMWTSEARTQMRIVRKTSFAHSVESMRSVIDSESEGGVVEPINMSMTDSNSGRGSEVPLPVDLFEEPTQRIFGGKSEVVQALSVLRELTTYPWFVRKFPEGVGERLTTALRWCGEVSAQSTNISEQRMAKVIESLLRLCAARGVDILARQLEALRPLEEMLDVLDEDWCEPVLVAARFWHSAALVFRRRGVDDLVHARGLLEKCLDSWQRMPGAERSIAAGYIRLAEIARLGYDLERAQEWIEKANFTGGKINDDGVIAEAAFVLGSIVAASRKYDESEVCFRKSLELYEQAGDARRVAACCRLLSSIELKRFDVVAARLFLNKSNELSERCGDVVGRLMGLVGQGDVELFEGSLELAERSFREAIGLGNDLDIPTMVAPACLRLSMVLKARGATDDAIINWNRAVEIFETMGMNPQADEARRAFLAVVGSPA